MSEQIITKRCSKCKEIKPLSEFYKNRTQKYGRSSYCKICQNRYSQTEKRKARDKRYSQSEKGKARQKRHEQTEKGRITRSKIMKRYHLQHPEQSKARQIVKKAIKEGKLPKVDSLQCACGKQAAEYHHHKGYAPEHWLDVIPVCIPCHNNLPVKPLSNR